MTATCKYIKAWIGPCSAPVVAEGEQCAEHQKKCSCGEPATRDCDETMGPFVCGTPICKNCEHTLCANGCNSGAALPKGLKSHCGKDQQVYQMWMVKDAEALNKKIYEAEWPEGRNCKTCQKLLTADRSGEFCSVECVITSIK